MFHWRSSLLVFFVRIGIEKFLLQIENRIKIIAKYMLDFLENVISFLLIIFNTEQRHKENAKYIHTF